MHRRQPDGRLTSKGMLRAQPPQIKYTSIHLGSVIQFESDPRFTVNSMLCALTHEVAHITLNSAFKWAELNSSE